MGGGTFVCLAVSIKDELQSISGWLVDSLIVDVAAILEQRLLAGLLILDKLS